MNWMRKSDRRPSSVLNPNLELVALIVKAKLIRSEIRSWYEHCLISFWYIISDLILDFGNGFCPSARLFWGLEISECDGAHWQVPQVLIRKNRTAYVSPVMMPIFSVYCNVGWAVTFQLPVSLSLYHYPATNIITTIISSIINKK